MADNPRKLVIMGAGPFAECAWYLFTHDSPFEVAAFAQSRDHIRENTFHDLPVIPFENMNESHPPEDYDCFVAIGATKHNQTREIFYNEVKKRGYTLPTYISSHSTHWPDLDIGDNGFVFEHNNIQPFVKIGNNVVLWSGNHIGHHSRIGDHCFLTSHVVVSGLVTIGSHCFLGVNATLRDGITIAERCIIGAGALILSDTKPGEVYKGTPTMPRESR